MSKLQDIKIILASDESAEEVESKLNNLTDQGYKLQSSSVEWYCGKVEGAFCLLKELKEKKYE